MDKIKIALDILKRDKTNNIGIINFIKNNRIYGVDIIGNSVLVRGESDRRWVYISCHYRTELNIIKNKLTGEDDNFAAIDDWMVPVLSEGKEVVWDLQAIQFYLPDNSKLPAPELNIKSLTEKDAATVYTNSEYKKYISLEYVKERIIHGISSGIYENNNLVSWAMTQDDGAIGFLHTLDNYRRKRYGYNVTLAMIEKLRRIKELPFGYVVQENKRSINLLCKLGFKENKIIHWFQIKYRKWE